MRNSLFMCSQVDNFSLLRFLVVLSETSLRVFLQNIQMAGKTAFEEIPATRVSVLRSLFAGGSSLSAAECNKDASLEALASNLRSMKNHNKNNK